MFVILAHVHTILRCIAQIGAEIAIFLKQLLQFWSR